MYDGEVQPQPSLPAKADSDHIIVYAMVRFIGHIVPNAYVRKENRIRPFDQQTFGSDEDYRQPEDVRTISKLVDLHVQPNRISERAESSTKVILDAVEAELRPHHDVSTSPGGERHLKSQRPSQSRGMRGRMHDDSCA